jgi:hypothetical protein
MFRILKTVMGLIIASVLFISCDAGIVGNGDVQTRTKSIDDFNRLEISGNFNVYLDQSGRPGLKIEADENIMDIIEVRQTGNTLEIRTEVNIIRAKKKDLYINFDELKKMEISGAVEIRADDRLKFKTLEITGGGAADINLDMEADWLRVDISGAADFDLTGEAREADLIISGAGGFDLIDLKTEKMSIDISGAAHARVYATEDLDVEISGAGAVRYKGSPDIKRDISGIGSLKRY